MQVVRNEYPRPQFKRDEWFTLNGEWEFAFDDDNVGIKQGYTTGRRGLPLKINVPFTYQYPASGINTKEKHEIVWYKKAFKLKNLGNNTHALLCFNGCDYITDVWVNGHHVITHKGGFAPFNVDITDYVYKRGKENVVVIRCYDPYDPTIPRGKQSWTGNAFSCFYTPNTGIWQSVWVEYFEKDCISAYSIIPNIDNFSFYGELKTLHNVADECEIKVHYQGNNIKNCRFSLDGKYTRYSVNLMELDFVCETCFWTPECPNLFNVDFILYANGEALDIAHTRFGMRKISVDESGKICLNNRPLYQRLILDQGYWEEGGLTPPSVDAIKKDIELCMQMGFNGARKHQKFEDPYFYYLADELGYLTWCEMPSAYNFNADEISHLTSEWQEIITAARNFTSVICYVPLNESWGTRKILNDKNQQDFARSLYYLTKAFDNTRLVSTNDGWENIDATDIISIHDYAYDNSQFANKYRADKYNEIYPQGRKLMCENCSYKGQPVLFSEFGGIAMGINGKDNNWGYGCAAENEEAFLLRYSNLLAGIYNMPDFQGFCYTQVSDVQLEVNGLLDATHQPKYDLEKIKKITLKQY